MSIQLAPESEAILNRLVASGDYPTTSAAVAAAVTLLDREAERRRKHEALKALIDEGVQAVERGEVQDLDEAFDEVEIELFGHRLADQ